MYKFPEEFDPAIFVGRTLEMVCANATQVYFHFNDDLYVCAESAFGFERPDKRFSDVQIPLDQCDVFQLLEHNIARARIKRNAWFTAISVERDVARAETTTIKGDVLILIFDNGASLRFDPTPGYESYRVVVSGKEIFI
jgi:hypothetical protein